MRAGDVTPEKYRPKAWEWAVWIVAALLVTVPDLWLALR